MEEANRENMAHNAFGTRMKFSEMPPESINVDPINPYYECLREDAIAAVPSDAKRVLSVGCAAGKTEEVLIKKGIEVVGVELNPEAARIARQRGLTILEGDVSEIDVGFAGKFYDFIIYADILEHLPDPVAVLKRHVQYLKPGGSVHVSIPNFRHYSVLWELFVRGHVRYKDAGILDRTHLRMTTRKMAIEWLRTCGLKLIAVEHIFGRRRYKLLSRVFCNMIDDFIAPQITVTGKK